MNPIARSIYYPYTLVSIFIHAIAAKLVVSTIRFYPLEFVIEDSLPFISPVVLSCIETSFTAYSCAKSTFPMLKSAPAAKLSKYGSVVVLQTLIT